MRVTEPYPRISDSEGLGWGPRICASLKFPGDAGATGPEPHLENHSSGGSLFSTFPSTPKS